jgi:hypothetical protein
MMSCVPISLCQVLLLAWKMGAQQMGFFSRDEFLRGLKLLSANTLEKLRKALPKLEDEVSADPEAFSSFFTFAFKFLLTVCYCVALCSTQHDRMLCHRVEMRRTAL